MAVSETLRSVIDAGQSSKRLDELSSARVIGKIARQVHAAQQKAGAGKAIGPITPGHIALSSTGEASLEIKSAGSMLGYSAPEQIAGGSGDRRSDVFSLGAVMWEALTHTRLFDAMNDAAVKVAVQEREIATPAEVNANIPAELSAICMRALARNPTDRYQSLKSMAVEIEEFLEEAGYTDDDSKIAQYIAGMGQPAPQKRSPLANAPAAPPSILTDKPVETTATKAAEPTRAKRPSGADVAAALASVKPSSTAVGVPAAPVPEDWQDKVQPSHAPIPAAAPIVPLTPMPPVLPSTSTPAVRADKATIAAMVPPQVKVTTAGATSDATPSEAKAETKAETKVEAKAETKAETKVETKAEAKVEATHAEPKADPKQTLIGTPIGEPKAPVEAKAEPKAEVAPETKPQANANANAEAKPESTSDAKPDSKSTIVDDQRATLVDSKPPEMLVAAAAATNDKSAAPKSARAASEADKSKPNPADVVSLPGRESKGDLLAGWGWGTGKNDAVAPADYTEPDEELEPPNNRKPLMYAVGGGLAVALLITIMAFAAGGSDDKRKAQTAKSTSTSTATPAAVEPQPAPLETGSGTAVAQPSPPPVDPAAQAAEEAAAKAAAEQAAKDEAARVDAEKQALAQQEKLAKEEAEKQAKADAAAKAAADKLAKQEAQKLEAEQKRLVREETAKAEAERKRLAKEEAEKKRLAREEARKQAATKAQTKVATTTKTEPKKTTKTETKTETKTVAKAEPSKSVDVETAYRIGLQQFARGDTSGALASLRTSLAGNPNYAPTWRGLGLVFEKIGEKAQARAAYKRYLQLAPSAGDAEIIRGRLERLGS